MISVEFVRDKTSAVATLCERDSSAPSVVSRLSSVQSDRNAVN